MGDMAVAMIYARPSIAVPVQSCAAFMRNVAAARADSPAVCTENPVRV